MRNTKQRELILKIVNESYDHLTTDEIYKKCKTKIPNISLGTVYRNLNNLVEENEIIRLKFDNVDRFDAKRCKHHHFVCIKCKKIIDVNTGDLKVNIDNNKVIDYEIKFTGICEECLRKEV